MRLAGRSPIAASVVALLSWSLAGCGGSHAPTPRLDGGLDAQSESIAPDAGPGDVTPDAGPGGDATPDAAPDEDVAPDAGWGDGGPGDVTPDGDATGRDAGDEAACPGTASRCDDGNPCTLDGIDSTCACVHQAVTAETACDDGDACSQGDRCVAGLCAGRPSASVPAIQGSLQSFAQFAGTASVLTFVADDRIVVASGRTLALLKLESDRLVVADRRDVARGPRGVQIGPLIWVDRLATFFIPLANRRLAVLSSLGGIDVYDLSEDRLTPSASIVFPSLDNSVTAASGSGSRLWTCSGLKVQTYNVDSTTFLITTGSSFNLPTGHSCLGLSLSPDGATLLAATSSGLDLLDVSSNDGSISRRGGGLAGQFLLDVATTGDHVVVYRLNPVRQSDGSTFADSGFGDVTVLAADTLSPIANFPKNLTGVTPIGFAIVGGGLLLQQLDNQACPSYSAEYYALGPSSVQRKGAWTLLSACQHPAAVSPGAPVHTVGRGNYAVVEPTHQLLRIDPGSGAMTPINGLQQGSFERIRAVGPHAVEVHSATSMHLVDITDPRAPAVVAGGLLAPVNVEGLRLVLSGRSSPASFLTVPTDAQKVAGPVTTLYWERDGALPTIAGSIQNDDPDGQWLAAGASLYQLSVEAVVDFRLRRFPVSGLTRQQAQKAPAEFDGVLATGRPADLEDQLGAWFDVDRVTGDLAVLELRRHALDSASRRAVLTWFSRKGNGYELAVARPPEVGFPVGMAIDRGQCVMAFENRVSVVARSGDVAVNVMLDSTRFMVNRLLAVTDKLVYLAALFRGTTSTNGVLVLRRDDLSELGRYTTPETVLSLAQVGENLVFGMTSGLTVASLACPAPQP